MMDNKNLLIGIGLYGIASVIIWIQIHAQLMNQWAKDNPMILSVLLGIPISYLFIIGAGYLFDYYNGTAWPSRMLGFSVNIVIFTIMTWVVLGETVSNKTIISILLSIAIIIMQVI
jgi:hypothetical protein